MCVYVLVVILVSFLCILGRNVQMEVLGLQRKFGKFRNATCVAVASRGIGVDSLVDKIMDLPGVRGAHDKKFFMKYSDKLRESKRVQSVFDRLGSHWDYLHPEIYCRLIQEIPLTELRRKEEDYRNELDSFLDRTPVDQFSKIPGIEQEKNRDPPPHFKTLFSKHIWRPPPPVSLRKVEEFRCKFANKCNLQSCAVTIASVTRGCVAIKMWVPESIELGITPEFINAHSIIRMEFDGMIVYSQVSGIGAGRV